MFVHNKYFKIYYNIVNRAKSRKISTYIERHHIIPKSLGGTNDPDNIVELTAREHYICHRLLTKITTGKNKSKMLYAAWRLTNLKDTETGKRYRITSRTYNTVREEHAQYLKSLAGPNHHSRGNTIRKGIILSEEQKQKQSLAMKGKPAWNKGLPRSQEVKDAVSKANKGRPAWNKGISRRWVNNGNTNRLVYPEELQTYLTDGWVQGRY